MAFSPATGLLSVAPIATDSRSADPGNQVQNWASLIGIVIAIVGNTLIALALNVQRYAHIRIHREKALAEDASKHADHNDDDTADRPRESSTRYGAIDSAAPRGTPAGNGHHVAVDSDVNTPLRRQDSTESRHPADRRRFSNATYLRSPYWWMGQVLITVGETGNFLAYGFAPASIVSPLGIVALIANCIIAPIIFHERFRAQDFWGVGVAVCGAVTVVLSAKQEEVRLHPDDIWKAITTTAFEIYMAVTVALVIILALASRRYGRRTILIDLGLVGIFGGYTALATKGVSSMLSWNFFAAFTTPITYLLLTVLLSTAVLQVRYVNRALQRFDSTQVIPVQFVMFTMSVIIGSAVLYRDFERTTLDQAIKFTAGCLLTFFGVFLITTGRPPRDDRSAEHGLSDAEGVAETIGLSAQGAAAQSSAQMDESSASPSSSRRSSRASRLSHQAISGRPAYASNDGGTGSSLRIPPHRPKPPISESAPIISTIRTTDEPGAGLAPPMYTDCAVMSPDQEFTVPAAWLTPTSIEQDHLHTATHTATPDAPTPRASAASTPRRQSLQRTRTFFSPSPLSTTVAAVVKDALLGQSDDYEFAPQTSLRRIRSSIRASLFLDDPDELAGGGGVMIPQGHRDIPSSSGGHLGQEHHRDRRLRARSLSDTIGDLFARVPRRKKKTKDIDGAPESGTEDEEGALLRQSAE